MVQAMSEEQLKAAVEPTEQVEENVEEISEDDLDGVTGGLNRLIYGEPATPGANYVC